MNLFLLNLRLHSKNIYFCSKQFYQDGTGSIFFNIALILSTDPLKLEVNLLTHRQHCEHFLALGSYFKEYLPVNC